MLGLRIIVYRLHLNVAYRDIPLQYNPVAHIAADICKDMVDFLDTLTGPDLRLFWFPCMPVTPLLPRSYSLTPIFRYRGPYIQLLLSSFTDSHPR